MTTGELIRHARISAGLTQKELGERAGIAEPTIGRYELGKLNPKPSTLKKIADAIGVSWSSLLPESLIEKSDDLANYELIMTCITKAQKDLLNNSGHYDTEYVKQVLSSLQDIADFLKRDLQGELPSIPGNTTTICENSRSSYSLSQQEEPAKNDKKPKSNDAESRTQKNVEIRLREKNNLECIIKDYKTLSLEGQQVAVERVHELTEIPRYKRKDTPEE